MKHGFSSTLIILFALFCFAVSPASLALQELRLGCVSSDGMKDVERLRNIVEPVLQSHGYTLKIVPMSAERLIRELAVDDTLAEALDRQLSKQLDAWPNQYLVDM